MTDSVPLKKRKKVSEGSSGVDSPRSSKSTKVDKQDEDSTIDPVLLSNMNKALSVEINEKKRKIDHLKKLCEEMFKSRGAIDSSYKCIRRHWLQLLCDLKLLLACFGNSENSYPLVRSLLDASDPFDGVDVNSLTVLSIPDWFTINPAELEGSLSGVKKQEQIPSTVESRLLEECRDTKSILSTVISAISESRNTRGSPEGEQKSQEALTRVMTDHRAATAELLSIRDTNDALKRRIAELKVDIERKEVERHRACRDLDRMIVGTDGKGGKPSKKEVEEPMVVDTSVPSTEEKNQSNPIGSSGISSNIQKIEEEISHLKTENTRLRNQVNELSNVSTQLNDQKLAKEKAEASVIQSQKEICAFKDAIKKMKEQEQEREAFLNKRWTDHYNEKINELANSKSKQDEQHLQLAQLQGRIQENNTYKKSYDESVILCNSLKSQLETIKARSKRSEKSGRELQKMETEGEFKAMSLKIEKLEKDYRELNDAHKNTLEQLKSSRNPEIKDLMEKIEQSNSELQKAKDEIIKKDSDIIKLNSSLEQSGSQVENAAAETDSLIAEIEAISKELDTLQTQHTRLLEQVQKKDEANRKVSLENSGLSRSKALLSEEMGSIRLKLTEAEETCNQLKLLQSKQKEAMELKNNEITQLDEQVSQLKKDRDMKQMQLKEFQGEQRFLHTKIETLQKSQAESQVALSAKDKPCHNCDKNIKKINDLSEELRMIRSAGSGQMKDVEHFELDIYRKMIKCSVCQDRNKDVIIAKCFHMFCKTCIDNNLKARNRKCPTCKKMFGQDDVKVVWVT